MPSTSVRRGLYWSEHTRTWHYEFRMQVLPGTKSRKFNGDTGHVREADARTWLAAFRGQLKDEAVGLRQAAPAVLTLRELVALFREKRGPAEKDGEGTLTPHTLRVVELRARLHWGALLDLPLTRITTAEVEDMRQRYLSGDGRRSKGGANKVVATLHTVLAWGVGRGLLAEVPFKVGKIKAQRQVKAVVWPEQQRAFLRASRACRNVDARVALATCLLMGLREAEALGLRWEWCDWLAGVYRVGKAKDFDVREVPMHPFWRRLLRLRWILAGRPAQGWILTAKDEAPHREGYLRKPTATTAAKLKLIGLHPHRLRASFATACWEVGASIAQIQAWLGHEDPSTSMLYIAKRALKGAEVQARCAAKAGWPIPLKSPKKSDPVPKHSKQSTKK